MERIYFVGSMARSDGDRDINHNLIEHIRSLGIRVVHEQANSEGDYDQTIAKRDDSWTVWANGIIAEVSNPSFQTETRVLSALDSGKSVLALTAGKDTAGEENFRHMMNTFNAQGLDARLDVISYSRSETGLRVAKLAIEQFVALPPKSVSNFPNAPSVV